MSVHGFVTDVLRHDTRILPILRSVGNLHRSGKCPCPRNGASVESRESRRSRLGAAGEPDGAVG